MCGREKEDEKEKDLIRVCVCVFVGVLAALADQEPELDEREHCNFCSSATKIDALQMKRQKVCPQLDGGQSRTEREGRRLRKQTRSKSKRLKNGKMCMAKEKH